MSTTIRTEKRKRGFFGWIFLIAFWAFNALMLFWLVAGLGANGEAYGELTTDAARAGYAAGTALATGFIMAIWVAGALILGLFVLLTQGRKVIVETTKE